MNPKSVHMPTAATLVVFVVVVLAIYHFAHKH